MSKYLVVIEAPGKRKKIQSILGAEYDVAATSGHIADLPSKGLNVNIKKDFEPTYGIMDRKGDVVKDILARAKKAEKVYIATDQDREGEGIGWHVARLLPKGTEVHRILYGSLSKNEILNAIDNPSDIDMDKVYAYETRRVLDRICGYKTSYIVAKATGGPSAGRTQSAGLRILSEREKEISAFVPLEYWPIQAELLTDRGEKIIADIKIPKPLDIRCKEDAEKICDKIKKGPVVVSKFEKKEVSTRPYPPFTTSAMYQSAGGLFGWKSDRTASVAQKLYEAGVCSYHRTDSTFIVPDFVTNIRGEIQSSYGNAYAPEAANVWVNKKGSQEAHEACRVTDLDLVQYTSGSSDEKRLYEMIWKRTVASQMSDMKVLRISAEFSCGDWVLGSRGAKILFDGWRKVWDYGDVAEATLPEMTVGEVVKVIDIKTERKETQPPPRYTERSFIKILEDSGIGRPSTYASIPKTLSERGYIENNKNIKVTDLGIRVTDFVVDSNFCFAEIKFTSELEDKLDDISSRKTTKLKVLTEFWARLKQDIENAKLLKKEKTKTDFDCPKCDGKLCHKYSRFGPFFSCEKYPECKYKASVGENGEPVEKKPVEKEYSEIACPKCNKRLIVRKGRKGDFLGCEGFPSCSGIYDLEGKKIEIKVKSKFKKKRGGNK